MHILLGKRTNPNIWCVGISVNMSKIPFDLREQYLENLAGETGLPCIDPLIDGCDTIVNYIKKEFFNLKIA